MKTIWAKVCLPIIILAALVSLAGCGDSRLAEAERLLETDVKAADSILSSMPMPTSRRDRAWYAVLKTQADYKQYKTITSDSLILTATSYYGINHKGYRTALAWYSQGCIYAEMKDDIMAIESFLYAMDLFPDTLIRYYAFSAQNVGDILLQRELLSEASAMYKRAKRISEIINDSSMIVYADFKQSLIYLREKEYLKADSLFQYLVGNPYLSNYNRMEVILGMSKVATFNDCDYSRSIYLTDYCINSKSHSAAGYNQRGINFMFQNDMDSAKYCFIRSLSCPSDVYTDYSNYSCLWEIAIYNGELEQSKYYLSLCETAIDSIMTMMSHEEISSVLLSYNNKKSMNEVMKTRDTLQVVIIISSIVVLFILIISIVERDRNIKKYYIEKNDQLLETVSISVDDTLFDVFNNCRKSFDKSVSSSLMRRILKDRKSNSNDSIVIRHDIKTCFKEFYLRITDEKQNMSKGDFECLVCVLLNLENKDIALVLDKSYSTITSVKARLKSKIPEELLQHFC